MLLEIVTFTGNIGCNLQTVGQAHSGNFAKGGIGLLWCNSSDLNTNATALRRSDVAPPNPVFQRILPPMHSRCTAFRPNPCSALLDQLINGRQRFTPLIRNTPPIRRKSKLYVCGQLLSMSAAALDSNIIIALDHYEQTMIKSRPLGWLSHSFCTGRR